MSVARRHREKALPDAWWREQLLRDDQFKPVLLPASLDSVLIIDLAEPRESHCARLVPQIRTPL
jgi:hypothetical protein